MFTLNRPEKLNALTLSMIRNMTPQLKVRHIPTFPHLFHARSFPYDFLLTVYLLSLLLLGLGCLKVGQGHSAERTGWWTILCR